MARKQSDYLASLLADDGDAPAPAPVTEAPPERPRATTLLGRESALARVASGEVRQVTQLLLDPARVRIWPGNARSYGHLDEKNCGELIDSIIAEGGQKVPAVVRRVEGDPRHDFEVIAGTRRHWSISWLRANSYPEMQFVAQVVQMDDEAAFRLADLENRARADVSDLERARNYLDALTTHYGDHQSRMAERLKLSKGWLSKMLKVATIPDGIVGAFASPADITLKSGYALAKALDTPEAACIVRMARTIVHEQDERRDAGLPLYGPNEVLGRLLGAFDELTGAPPPEKYRYRNRFDREVLSIESSNRQGATLRLHAGSGSDIDEILMAVRAALDHLDRTGKGFSR